MADLIVQEWPERDEITVRPSRAAHRAGLGTGHDAGPSQSDVEASYRHILEFVGEDPDREGLLRTPYRVAEALKFLTRGYTQDLQAILNDAVFEEEYEDMVVVKDIEFYSMCEHHMLPFFGKVHVGYMPNGRIVGLSKLPRIVDMFARRLQVQERLTTEIADAIEEALQPRGVAVVVEGAHMCMMMRGIQKQGATTLTSHVTGAFRTDRATRQEFMSLVRGSSQ